MKTIEIIAVDWSAHMSKPFRRERCTFSLSEDGEMHYNIYGTDDDGNSNIIIEQNYKKISKELTGIIFEILTGFILTNVDVVEHCDCLDAEPDQFSIYCDGKKEVETKVLDSKVTKKIYSSIGKILNITRFMKLDC